MKKHFEILDIVLHRLAFHGWKINCEKLIVAAREAKILGWVIKEGELRADPERIRGILASEFPKNRKGMMAFTALVGTLRRVMPREAASELAKLYELTSVKRDYKPNAEHHAAFDACKKFLTTEPLFVKLPDVNKVKILFSDSSSNIIGGVLAQVKFEELQVSRNEHKVFEARDFSPFDQLGRLLIQEGLKIQFEFAGVGTEDALLRAVILQLQQMELKNFPKTPREFKKSLELQRSVLVGPGQPRLHTDYFAEEAVYPKLLKLIAIYLQRDLVVFGVLNEELCVRGYNGTEPSEKIPPLFLGFNTLKGDNKTHWYSLCVLEKTKYSPFTSYDQVTNDYSCLLYTSPSPRDRQKSRMPSSA